MLEQGIFGCRGHNWKGTIRNRFFAESPEVLLVTLWPRSSCQQVFLHRPLQLFAASAVVAVYGGATTISSYLYFFNKVLAYRERPVTFLLLVPGSDSAFSYLCSQRFSLTKYTRCSEEKPAPCVTVETLSATLVQYRTFRSYKLKKSGEGTTQR